MITTLKRLSVRMIRLKVRRITRAVVIPSTLHIWPNHYQKGVYIWKKLMNEKEPGTILKLIIQKRYQIKNLNSLKPSTQGEKLKLIFCQNPKAQIKMQMINQAQPKLLSLHRR